MTLLCPLPFQFTKPVVQSLLLMTVPGLALEICYELAGEMRRFAVILIERAWLEMNSVDGLSCLCDTALNCLDLWLAFYKKCPLAVQGQAVQLIKHVCIEISKLAAQPQCPKLVQLQLNAREGSVSLAPKLHIELCNIRTMQHTWE